MCVKMTVFWAVLSCGLVEIHRCFRSAPMFQKCLLPPLPDYAASQKTAIFMFVCCLMNKFRNHCLWEMILWNIAMFLFNFLVLMKPMFCYVGTHRIGPLAVACTPATVLCRPAKLVLVMFCLSY